MKNIIKVTDRSDRDDLRALHLFTVQVRGRFRVGGVRVRGWYWNGLGLNADLHLRNFQQPGTFGGTKGQMYVELGWSTRTKTLI